MPLKLFENFWLRAIRSAVKVATVGRWMPYWLLVVWYMVCSERGWWL